MKAKVKQITVTINENEALAILNAIKAGLKGETWDANAEEKGAADLAILLNGNFFSSTKDVHFIN